jgi:type I restriction enzyme S subunit
MPGDWREATLDQLGRIVTGKTPSSGGEGLFGGDIPFVTPTDFDGRRVIESTGRYLSEQGAEAVSGSRIPNRAVMVSCIGSDMGKAAVAGRACVTNQQINSLVVDTDDDPLFLYYNLSARKAEIRAAAGGSAQPILNKSAFGRLNILLPPPNEQRAISHILGTLDDKIELNRRMSETLEAMARSLFRSWFVDFDPVRAKAEGRDPGLPKPLADLFPSRFVDSELGEIPEGWEVSSLGMVVEVVDCLHAKKPDRREMGAPFLQLANIRDDGLINMEDTYLIDEADYRKWISRMEASPEDCVITNVGRVGAVAQMPLGLKAALGRNMTGIRCKPSFPFPTVLVECLLSQAMKDEIVLKMDTGTILNALNVRNIPRLRFVRPSADEILEFLEGKVRSLRAQMERSLAESHSLAALRDTLLAKLISGEVRVKDAGEVIRSVTT